MKRKSNIQVEFAGSTYEWNGRVWFDRSTFQRPPREIAIKLDLLAHSDFAEEDEGLADFDELLQRARNCRDAGQFDRAFRLARRAFEMNRYHHGAAAVLSSCARATHQPALALEVTAHLALTDYVPLIISRSAALCDLERWEEAKRTLAPALAMADPKKKHEAFAVVDRIKSARPDLYPGPA